MGDWSHGYDVSVGYTYGFYHEMTPDWLDLCTRIAGFIPPRRGPSAGFRYLELGTGQGLGLCLLAAANPQGEFLGIDFHPEHIAHAEAIADMAGLTNIRFVEADFADLGEHWPEDFGTFDYVALHGIYSWVPPKVRDAVIRCLAHATRPGGIIYNSYNTQPGWLGSVAFQHISQRLKETSGKPGKAVFEDSINLFEKLSESNAAIFKAMPSLKTRIDAVKKQKSNYLIQEYLHESWNPLWHSQVARELGRAKLGYVGSATIAETMLPGMLPAPMREILSGQQDGSLRQDLQDIMINQAFRRDIFCRGARRSVGGDIRTATRLYLASPPEAGAAITVKTVFGTMNVEYASVAGIFEALAAGAMSIEEIVALPGLRADPFAKTMKTLVMLLQVGVLAVGPAEQGDEAACHRLNAVIARAGSQGTAYRHIAAPKLGGAVSVKDFDLLLIDSWLEASGQADGPALARAVAARLAKMGRELIHEGKSLKGAEAEKHVAGAVKTFLDVDLPRWRQLGALA